MRTVLLNTSSTTDSGQLWEVLNSTEDGLSDWEQRTSASYRHDIDTHSWSAKEMRANRDRRQKKPKPNTADVEEATTQRDKTQTQQSHSSERTLHWYVFWPGSILSDRTPKWDVFVI